MSSHEAEMFRDGPADRNRPYEDFDETLRMSQSTAASIESAKPIPDIHPYLEIGKSLQNLRRSVFDMYTDEVNKSVRSAERTSPPLATTHQHSTTNSSNHHHTSRFEAHYHTSQHDSILLTPSAFAENSIGRLASGHSSAAHRTPTSEDREPHNKHRTSTPYRHIQRDSDDFGGSVHNFSASDLNDSREELPPAPQTRTERGHTNNITSPPQRPPQHPHPSETYKRHNRSGSESYSDEASLQRRRLHSHVEVHPSGDLASHSSSDSSYESSRDEHTERRGKEKGTASASASVEVGHAIAVIVGQHEERFNT